MEQYQLIDYDHAPGDWTCNAVVTAERGGVEAVWTVDRHGQFTTEAYLVANDVFALLWKMIAASLDMGGVFRTCLVIDPTRLIDPATHHVIATVEVEHGQSQHRMFMVPADEVDPTFLAWLSLLNATAQPRRTTSVRNARADELAAV